MHVNRPNGVIICQAHNLLGISLLIRVAALPSFDDIATGQYITDLITK